jgi:hypothetical protein
MIRLNKEQIEIIFGILLMIAGFLLAFLMVVNIVGTSFFMCFFPIQFHLLVFFWGYTDYMV